MQTPTWQETKPTFNEECIVIAACKFGDRWDYTLFQILETSCDEGTYLGWFTGEGEEYGDLADLHAHKYLVLPLIS